MKKKRVWMLVIAGAAVAAVAVAVALWHMERMKRIDRLAANLTSGNAAVRADAAKRLGALTDSGDIERLLTHLGDENDAVRKEVVTVAAGLGERVIVPLEAAMRGFAAGRTGGEARDAVEQAVLGNTTDEPHERQIRVWRGVAPLLDQLGKPGADLVLKLMWDEDPKVRELAAMAMSTRGMINDEMTGTALKALANPDPNVRVQAMLRLGWSGETRAIEPLLGNLADGDQRVARTAAISLGYFADDPRVTPRLINIALGSGGSLQDSACRAFVIDRLGFTRDHNVLDAFVSLLGDKDRSVRSALINAFGALQDDRKWAALVRSLSDSKQEVREGAYEVLSKSADVKEIAALVEAYADANPEGRKTIVRLLTALANLPAGGTAPLGGKSRLIDPDVPKAAKEALDKIGSRQRGQGK